MTILSDAEGRTLLESDSARGMFGSEALCFVSDRPGLFQITIKAFDPEVVPGSYSLRLTHVRRASDSDRTRARASLAVWRGLQEEKASTIGSLERARDAYRLAARLWHRAGEPAEESATLYSYGNILRGQGDLRGARAAYTQALDRARRGRDPQLEAKILVASAWDNSFLGNSSGAAALADTALALSVSIGDRQNQSNSLYAKGSLLLSLGRYQDALDCSQKALTLAEGLRDRAAEAWALEGIGSAYSALGESVRALRAFERSQDLFRATNDFQGLTYALQNAGFLCWQMGAYRKALSIYEQSLSLAVKAGFRQSEALAGNNIALAHLSLGELEAARGELERALKLWRAAGEARGEALSLHNLGRVHDLLGRPDASDFYRRALASFRSAGDRAGEARVLASMAQAEARAGRLEDARARIEESLSIFDSLGRELAVPGLRGSFLALRQNAYAIAVDVLARLDASRRGQGFAAEAFRASERARARTLVESLTEARLDLGSELPEDLRRREASLSGRLAELQKSLRRAGDRKVNEERMDRAEEEWDALIGEIRRRNPRYASLRYPEPIAWTEARGLLDSETAIVSFSVTADRIILLRLTANGVEARALAVGSRELEERVENYVGLISKDDVNRWKGLGQRLSSDVVAPWLTGLPAGVRRLIIVPDGPLHSLPFEALPDGEGRSLLDRFAVSYAPSVTLLAALRALPEPARSNPVAVFALANPAVARGVALSDDEGESFDPEVLRFAESEARRVFRLGGAGSELWVGPDAGERRVKGEDLRRFGVLHFATHALLSSRVPTRSSLLLAPDGNRENGLLQVREIYRLSLASELVTLSACRTARGRILPGEGVQGLAQAFFHAGVRSVLASLWDVSDRRTARLMDGFYRHLAAGEPKAQALRAAKQELLREEPDLAPRYWAAFVLIGDGTRSVPLRPPSWWRRVF